jgi:hypothetical protein
VNDAIERAARTVQPYQHVENVGVDGHCDGYDAVALVLAVSGLLDGV